MRVLRQQEVVGLFQAHRQSLQTRNDVSMFIGFPVQIRAYYRRASHKILENYNVLPFKGQERGTILR